MLARLRRTLARRGAAWVKRRQGVDRLPAVVHARRLYILPSRSGAGFAALLLFMLLAGLNYANSLALFLTFLLAGVAIVSMHLAHRNLLGLRITMAQTVNGFAAQTGRIVIAFANDADVTRFALRVSVDLDATRLVSQALELPGRTQRRQDLELPLARRGRVTIERIRISTHYPFGLFEAWTWLHLPLSVLAYPAARGGRSPPAAAHGGTEQLAVHRPGDDEWSHLRAFRDGDSPRQIAWAAYARTGQLLSKEYVAPRGAYRIFDIGELRGLALEQQLEQLSAWVVGAHERGERYGLQLTDTFVEPGAGLPHRDRCLAALAVVGLSMRPTQ